MKTLQLYFLFYKTTFFLPLALTLFVVLKYRMMPLAVLALFTASLLVWFYQNFISDPKKEKLYFYYNLGITELSLYTFVFIINLISVTIINICLKWIV